MENEKSRKSFGIPSLDKALESGKAKINRSSKGVLLKKENELKEHAQNALGVAGTTVQKAQENQYTIDLAKAALQVADEEEKYD